MVKPNETEFKQKISIIRDQFEVCTPYLTTLSDPVRQKILLILAESGTDGMDVQDITAKISLSRPAISHHLKILKDAGARQNYEVGKHSSKSRKKHRHGIHKRKSSMDAEFTFKLKSENLGPWGL